MIMKTSRKGLGAVGWMALMGLTSGALPVLASTPLMQQDDLLKAWKQGGLTAVKRGSAIILTSPKKMGRPALAQAGFNPQVALRKGEIVQVRFSIRCVSPASGSLVRFGVEGGEKYESQGKKELKLTSKVQNVNLSFPAKGNYAVGKWQVTFGLGALAQSVQVSNLSLIKK